MCDNTLQRLSNKTPNAACRCRKPPECQVFSSISQCCDRVANGIVSCFAGVKRFDRSFAVRESVA